MSRTSVALCLALLLAPLASAKDKKILMPAEVLRAQTVFVMIAPEAGEPITDPTANRRAQDDVEKALMNWGRFRMVMEPESADLVILIRKGLGRTVGPTISGGPIDRRPGVIQPTDDGIRIGGRQGHDPSQPDSTTPQDSGPQVQNEIGSSGDRFEVYRGGAYSNSDVPVWSLIAKDALRPPAVPAVEQFRKAIEEAEKNAAKKSPAKKQHP